MNPFATHLPTLEHLFKTNSIKSVFEFGTGLFSTPFFCGNSQKVIAVEMQDHNWFIKVKEELKTFNNLTMHSMLGPTSAIEYFKQLDMTFDLVFVDGHGDSRPECIQEAFKKSKIIVTHDTEEPMYGWTRIKKPDNFTYTVYKSLIPWTSVWEKVGD